MSLAQMPGDILPWSMSETTSSELSLPIEGMTCASCVNRIERFLSRTPGVEAASVNLATETATIRYRPDVADRTALVEAIEASGYDVRPDVPAGPDARPVALADEFSADDQIRARESRTLLLQASVSIALAAAIMVATFGASTAISMSELNRWVLIPATIVQFWAGRRFYRSAWRATRHGTANMDTLVVVGTTAAWGYSVVVTLWPAVVARAGIQPEAYFDTATIIIGLVLLGRWLELRAKVRTTGAIRGLVALSPTTATILRDGIGGANETVALDSVHVGDLLRVRPGDRVPVDGVVVDGASTIDRSMLTGEPSPVVVGPGDEVIGATLNTTGSFVMRATRVGRDTALARIVELVRRAQGSKAPIQRLADRVAEVFVPIVLILASATFAFWFAFGPEPRLTWALTAFISVVVIACPCAMGLATPTAIMVGTGRGAEAGILIRGGEALETAHRVGSVVLDKTGTLTLGRPAVEAVIPVPGHSVAELLDLAAALENLSEHPLGAAIVARARLDELGFGRVSGFAAIAGSGVSGTVDDDTGRGREVVVGDRRLVTANVVDPAPIAAASAEAAIGGRTTVYVAVDGSFIGVIVIGDPLKPEAAEAVRDLTADGIDVWLLTGDGRSAADVVARQVGIRPDRVQAEARPDDKAAMIARLQSDGRIVAMVGDGINDAPALALSDLGIAIGTGADVAVEASDVTLVGGDPRAVGAAIQLSRATMAVIRQNLFWAFAYNIVLIPVAMGVLYPAFGITLSPALAAGAMALSSVSVVANSLRLRGFDARRPLHSGDAPAPAREGRIA